MGEILDTVELSGGDETDEVDETTEEVSDEELDESGE